MKKIFIVNVLFLFLVANANCQNLTNRFDENRLQIRVKQLDEFIERFNYTTNIEGNKINTFDISKRKNYILGLFNQKIIPADKPDSMLLIINNFINTVCNKKTENFIHFEDANWYAQAYCKVKFKNKIHDISIVLKPEKIKEFEYKWVIAAVETDFLKLKPEKRNPGLMISPVDNEVNFMSLPDITNENSTNVLNYAGSNYQTDELSVFFALIKTGLLKIQNVQNIKYHYLQIPEWIFTVEHFERDSENVGWLISSIQKVNSKSKTEYSKTILNLY